MRGTVCSLSEMTSTTLDRCGGQWSGSDWVFWCNEWLAEQHCWRDLSILSNFVLPEKEILWVTWFGFCSSLLSPLCHTGQSLSDPASVRWLMTIHHPPSIIDHWLTVDCFGGCPSSVAIPYLLRPESMLLHHMIMQTPTYSLFIRTLFSSSVVIFILTLRSLWDQKGDKK